MTRYVQTLCAFVQIRNRMLLSIVSQCGRLPSTLNVLCNNVIIWHAKKCPRNRNTAVLSEVVSRESLLVAAGNVVGAHEIERFGECAVSWPPRASWGAQKMLVSNVN